MSGLTKQVLSRIVNTVADCDLGYTDLTAKQTEHIFSVMASRTRLRRQAIRYTVSSCIDWWSD